VRGDLPVAKAKARKGKHPVHRRGGRDRARTGAELPAPRASARILSAYQAFADEPGFAAVADVADVLAADGNLSIARYVKRPKAAVAGEEPRWRRPGRRSTRKGATSGRAWTRWWTCSMA
jgi:hypothetical protein